jgi:hypothetical protein
MKPNEMIKGQTYHWTHDPHTRLTYIGNNWSGNGYWHQFEKVSDPGSVWCEILDSELPLIVKSDD